MDEVAAVKDRQAGKIFERGGDEIIILSHPANGWVWITA
jgi:hypothetical protein